MAGNAKFNLLEAVKIKVGKSLEFDDVNLTNLLLVRILARLDALEKNTGASLQLQLATLEDELAAWVVKNFVLPVPPWNTISSYAPGFHVSFMDITYTCQVAVGPTTSTPLEDTAHWTAA